LFYSYNYDNYEYNNCIANNNNDKYHNEYDYVVSCSVEG
jgi:hypothetical protein